LGVLWSFMPKVIKVILFCVVLVVTVVCGIMIFDKEKTIEPIEVLLILGVVGPLLTSQ
jgi:lipoprotein signal peptidase